MLIPMKRKENLKTNLTLLKNPSNSEQVTNLDSWKYYFVLAIILLLTFIVLK